MPVSSAAGLFRVVGRAFAAVGAGLIEPFRMFSVNQRVAKAAIDTADIQALGDDDLKELLGEEWERAQNLDDKLQKLTAALSVAVTVGGLVGSTMLQDVQPSVWRTSAALLFLIAAIFLVSGVVFGFNGLRPKPRYGYGAGYRRIMAAGGDHARKELVAAARNFQRDNQVRSNETVAATAAIRNGVLVFVLAIAIGMLAVLNGKVSAAKPLPSVTIVNHPPMVPPAPAPVAPAEASQAPPSLACVGMGRPADARQHARCRAGPCSRRGAGAGTFKWFEPAKLDRARWCSGQWAGRIRSSVPSVIREGSAQRYRLVEPLLRGLNGFARG